MNMKKVFLIMMAAFLATGVVAGICAHFFRQENSDMLTRSEANRMVEESLRQAEIDIRQELDASDEAPVVSQSEEKPAEEEPAEEEPAEEEPAEEEPAEEPTVTHPFYRYTVVKLPLNYRNGPSTKDAIIGSVPVGTTGYVIEYVENGFSLCVVKDRVAYMHSRYLEVEEVEPSEVPAEYLGITAADAGKKVSEIGTGDASSTEAASGDTGASTSTDATTSDVEEDKAPGSTGSVDSGTATDSSTGDATTDNGTGASTTSDGSQMNNYGTTYDMSDGDDDVDSTEGTAQAAASGTSTSNDDKSLESTGTPNVSSTDTSGSTTTTEDTTTSTDSKVKKGTSR